MRFRGALVAFLLALMAAPMAHAQDRAQGRERRMEMMFKDITLTEAQKTKVDSVMAHYRTQMAPMTPGVRPDSAGMASRRSLMQKQNTDIRLLLTPAQQPIFDRNIEEMRNAMQRRQGGQ
jgi:Spy/CpxP family protein refolding chaperone